MNDFCLHKSRGFTLIEALASSVVLCTTVALIGAISSKTLWQIRANNDSLLAWQIFDEQMTTITQMGLTQFLAMGQTSGEVEYTDDNGQIRLYQWRIQVQEDATYSGLFRIDLTLGWHWNKKNRIITASTILYDESAASLMLPDSQDNPTGESVDTNTPDNMLQPQ